MEKRAIFMEKRAKRYLRTKIDTLLIVVYIWSKLNKCLSGQRMTQTRKRYQNTNIPRKDMELYEVV